MKNKSLLLFREALERKGMRQYELAKKLDITEYTLSRKIHHKQFNVSEIIAVSQILGLTNEEKKIIFKEYL